MNLLKEYIMRHGLVKSASILDVSSFLNMQMEPKLMKEIGKTFAEHYKDVDFDAYITVESSGIAPSIFASLYSDKPLVVIKKFYKKDDSKVQQHCYSYTKKQDYYLTADEKFLENKRFILIDDFLASGSVVLNVEKLCDKVNSKVIKTGICISKDFQEGMIFLKENGYDVISLAGIKKMDPETGSIEFTD